MEFLLRARGIAKSFAGVLALRGVDFDLKPGEGLVVHHRKGVVLATEPLGRPSA